MARWRISFQYCQTKPLLVWLMTAGAEVTHVYVAVCTSPLLVLLLLSGSGLVTM
jgi:hypothetical protein